MKRIKRYLIRLSIALFAFIIGFGAYLFAPPLQSSVKDVPHEPPIALVPSKENKGKRCEANTFYVPKPYYLSDYEVVDKFCADLQTKLNQAAQEGDVIKVRSLLAQGANPSSSSVDDDLSMIRPLPRAAQNGQWTVVRLLIDNGGDVNDYFSCCMTRKSLLMMAVEKGDVEAVRLLLARGADTGFTTYEGFTAYDIAALQNKEDIAQLFDEARKVSWLRRAEIRVAKLPGVNIKDIHKAFKK